ncbi:MAG: hypothetical protein ACXVJW_12760, partial [Acidimicrobiia bacterium]
SLRHSGGRSFTSSSARFHTAQLHGAADEAAGLGQLPVTGQDGQTPTAPVTPSTPTGVPAPSVPAPASSTSFSGSQDGGRTSINAAVLAELVALASLMFAGFVRLRQWVLSAPNPQVLASPG